MCFFIKTSADNAIINVSINDLTEIMVACFILDVFSFIIIHELFLRFFHKVVDGYGKH